MGFIFSDPLSAIPLPAGTLPRQTIWRLADNSADQVKLIRVLAGIADVAHPRYASPILQRTNYSVLGAPTSIANNLQEVETLLANVGISLVDLERRLQSSQIVSVFSAHFLKEICWYLFQSEMESFTTAFLHLYRALERVSYSFPMAYAAASTDYLKTFNELKGFFVNAEQGELKFFRLFGEKVLDTPLLDAQADFDFSGRPYAEKYCRIIELCCEQANVTTMVSGQSMSIQHRLLLTLTIEVRNRFFHFLSGKANAFSSDDLPDSDRFFQVINPKLMNWLGVIYFRVLSIEVSR